MAEEKGMTLTVVSTDEFEMLACKPEYGRASNGLPYSLVIHDKLVGGHEMAQFTKLVQMCAAADKDANTAELVDRAADITAHMIAVGLDRGWLRKVPAHTEIEKALNVAGRISGKDTENGTTSLNR